MILKDKKIRFLTTAFIFFVLKSNGIFCQNIELERYYENIYKAENYAIENKMDSSYYCYKKAFKFKLEPFTKDIYNAAVVSLKTERKEMVFKYFSLLIKRGVKYSELKESIAFNFYFSDKNNASSLNKLKVIKTTYDSTYRNALLKLVEDDQFFRTKNNSYKLYMDTIKKIDKRNINELYSLIKLYGFPTDEKIGVKSLEAIVNPIYALLILHQSVGPMQQFDLTKLVAENILNGNIDNKIGFYLFNRSSGGNNGNMFDVIRFNYVKVIDSTRSAANPNNIIIIDSTEYGYMPIDKKNLEAIEAERKKFMLDGYETNLMKILFCMKSPNFRFGVLGSTSEMNFTNYKDFIDEKERLKVFK